jgi:hypothetical protein
LASTSSMASAPATKRRQLIPAGMLIPSTGLPAAVSARPAAGA